MSCSVVLEEAYSKDVHESHFFSSVWTYRFSFFFIIDAINTRVKSVNQRQQSISLKIVTKFSKFGRLALIYSGVLLKVSSWPKPRVSWSSSVTYFQLIVHVPYLLMRSLPVINNYTAEGNCKASLFSGCN